MLHRLQHQEKATLPSREGRWRALAKGSQGRATGTLHGLVRRRDAPRNGADGAACQARRAQAVAVSGGGVFDPAAVPPKGPCADDAHEDGLVCRRVEEHGNVHKGLL